jgi:hypothetical protein
MADSYISLIGRKGIFLGNADNFPGEGIKPLCASAE